MKNSYRDFFHEAQRNKGIKIGHNKNNPQIEKAFKKGSPSKATQKKSRLNSKLLMVSVFGFFVTLLGAYFLDEVVSFLSKIEIGIGPVAFAEEGAASKSNSDESAKKSDSKDSGSQTKGLSESIDTIGRNVETASDVELNHFARLRERKLELDRREEELNKMESELAQQRKEIEIKIEDLESIRRNISSVLESRVQVDDQKIENLVQFYSNMKPPQAAKIIETIDEDLAVSVLSRMKKTNAANVMNLLPAVKAQSLSEKYVGYKK